MLSNFCFVFFSENMADYVKIRIFAEENARINKENEKLKKQNFALTTKLNALR